MIVRILFLFSFLLIISTIFLDISFQQQSDNNESEVKPENSFMNDLILIIVPVIGGALTTRWITNSWQIKNEKSKIKKQVLTEFANAEKRALNLCANFVVLFNDYYVFEIHNNVRKKFLKFPSEKSEQPLKKFEKEWKDLKKDLNETTFSASNFLSSLRLYYRNDELEQEYRALREPSNSVFSIVQIMYNCESLEELEQQWQNFKTDQKKAIDLIKKFEVKLVDTRLHKLVI